MNKDHGQNWPRVAHQMVADWRRPFWTETSEQRFIVCRFECINNDVKLRELNGENLFDYKFQSNLELLSYSKTILSTKFLFQVFQISNVNCYELIKLDDAKVAHCTVLYCAF